MNVLVDVTDGQSLRIGQKLKADGWNILYSPKEPVRNVAAVFGKIDFTENAMRNAGIVVPEPLGYPYCWAPGDREKLYGRMIDVWRLEDAIGWMATHNFSMFIKPANELKRFTGRVMFHDDYYLNQLNKKMEVWVSDVRYVSFEWRVLVCHGKRIAQPCYSDSCRDLTADELVKVDRWIEMTSYMLPAAYSMDVAIMNGRLAIVEFNDGWSLGGYGEDDAIIEVVFARFEELNKGKND